MNEHAPDLGQSSASADRPAAPEALPRSVLIVAIVIIAFIGLLSLETSDSFFLHDGQIARSLFVLPVAILLLHGVLTRCRWAWWATRIITALAGALYGVASVGVWIFSSHLQFGLRLWISAVSAGLLALVLSAFVALGRRPARSYFRVEQI